MPGLLGKTDSLRWGPTVRHHPKPGSSHRFQPLRVRRCQKYAIELLKMRTLLRQLLHAQSDFLMNGHIETIMQEAVRRRATMALHRYRI